MATSSVSNLSEAKKMYSDNLCTLLRPQIYEGLDTIWGLCKNSEQPLKNFQKKLEHVHSWNSLIIDDEYNRIVEKTKCSYLGELLDVIFITNAKILSTVGNNTDAVSINVPNIKKFIHSVYICCAYTFFIDPFMFDDTKLSTSKKQKNLKSILEVINKCINETLENLIPMEEILKSCLKKDMPPQIIQESEYPKLDILEGNDVFEANENIGNVNNSHILVNDTADSGYNYDNSNYNNNYNDDNISIPEEDNKSVKPNYNSDSDDEENNLKLIYPTESVINDIEPYPSERKTFDIDDVVSEEDITEYNPLPTKEQLQKSSSFYEDI